MIKLLKSCGDAGGEPADRHHFLRLAQLVLQPLALAQIPGDRHHAHHLAIADQHAGMHVHRNAAATPLRELRSKRLRQGLGAFGEHPVDRVEIVVAEDPVRIEAAHFFARITRGVLAGAVDRRHAAAAIVDDHHVARAIEHIVKPGLERGLARELAADRFLPPADAWIAIRGYAGENHGQRDGNPGPQWSGRHNRQEVSRGRLYHESAMSTTSSHGARTTLPAAAYMDPQWFANEMERVFARMWLAAGRAPELDQPGAFIKRDVAGASVLIVRAGDGSIEAFHNVCRHRGTRLCIEERGRFQGSIQCPYHAWTYGLDGRLMAAPQMDEVASFDRSEYPLRRVACETWDGHIFINLSAVEGSDSPAPLRAQLADLPSRFASWRMHELRLAHRIEYDIATNWKLVVQNYNECLHCPIIHPLLNRMHHYLAADNVPTTETYCGGAMGFKEGVETLSSDGKRRREFLPGSANASARW